MVYKCLFGFVLSFSLLAVELESSSPMITPGLSGQRAGVLKIKVTSNEFPSASTTPVYLRFSLPAGVDLDNTLADVSNPIDLGATLITTSPVFELLMSPGDVQLVHFQQGEDEFFIKINSDSDTWIGTGGIPLDGTPNQDAHVVFTIGITASVSNSYGIMNVLGGAPPEVSTVMDLDVSALRPLTEIRLIMTAYQFSGPLDPSNIDPDTQVPVTANQCPKIARTGLWQGVDFPFKQESED